MNNSAVIALNGTPAGTEKQYRELLTGEQYFIAADGGTGNLYEIGILPRVIIGDFDSLSTEELDFFRRQGVEIIEYPPEKDETDGELAVNYCLQKGFTRVLLTYSLGGQFDQQLANIYLLEYAYRKGLEARVKEPGMEIGVIGDRAEFKNYYGQRFSLLPLTDRAVNITNEGFKYPLNGEELVRYMTRGISNIITSEKAVVEVERGLLLYVLERNK